MANSVLPQPALPHTSVGRPRGNPPSVTSSRPSMPVGVFGRVPAAAAFLAGRASDLPIQEGLLPLKVRDSTGVASIQLPSGSGITSKQARVAAQHSRLFQAR